MGISTSHMLQSLENRLKSLLNSLEQSDPSLVIEAETVRKTND